MTLLGRSATMGSKGEQIVARLFLKVALLVSDARTTARDIPVTAGRADKWASALSHVVLRAGG